MYTILRTGTCNINKNINNYTDERAERCNAGAVGHRAGQEATALCDGGLQALARVVAPLCHTQELGDIRVHAAAPVCRQQ